jgi:hypothetical protein
MLIKCITIYLPSIAEHSTRHNPFNGTASDHCHLYLYSSQQLNVKCTVQFILKCSDGVNKEK